MKKWLMILIIMMNMTTASSVETYPKYKIIANSDKQEDIDDMYQEKDYLILKYRQWSQGIDDGRQVLIDHQKQLHGTYKQGVITITLGKGKGRYIDGTLKMNYCSSSRDIKKKSLIESLFQ